MGSVYGEIRQMDQRARKRLRTLRATGAPVDQAAAIREAVRYGLIEPRMVQLGAFLNHPACRLVADDVKPSGIVINNILLRSSDMGELATGIGYFGSKALSIFNLGLVRMSFAERKKNGSVRKGSPSYFTYPETRVVYLPNWIGVTTFVNQYYGNDLTERQEDTLDTNSGVDAVTWYKTAEQAALGRKEAIKELKTYRPPNNGRGYGHSWSSHFLLPKIILNLAHEGLCNERSRAKVLKFCNGFYDDEVILRYTSEQILPWALGEFYEGSATPPFVCYSPFLSTVDELRTRRATGGSATT